MWDLATGAPVGEPLTGHTRPVRSVAVTSDGTRIISGGDDGWLRVHELTTTRSPAALTIVSDAPPASLADVVDALRADDMRHHHTDTGQVPDPAVVRLTNTITALRRTGVAVHGDVATYQRWARIVARYSFDTYQLYTEPNHTEPDHTDR